MSSQRAAPAGRATFHLPALPAEAGAPPPIDVLAGALGLAAGDIGFGGFAPSCFTAGIGFTFVPLKSLDAVRRAKPDLARMAAMVAVPAHRAIFAFCQETAEPGHQFHARMFAPSYGIVEDPATGSAAAAFAGVVARFGGLTDGAHAIAIEQGYEMGRPSLIDLSLTIDDGVLTAASIGGEADHRDRRHDRGLTAPLVSRRLPAMTEPTVFHVDRLELAFAPKPWAFADERRAEIDAYFAELQREKPAIWNGRVLLLHSQVVSEGVFRGQYLETDYASFAAWRHWGRPRAGVRDCFGAAAVLSADGAFMLGVMGAHTANAGSIYFPCGTPDLNDVAGDTVDLDHSVARELAEETGLAADALTAEPGWTSVVDGGLIAQIKVMRSAEMPRPCGRACWPISRPRRSRN